MAAMAMALAVVGALVGCSSGSAASSSASAGASAGAGAASAVSASASASGSSGVSASASATRVTIPNGEYVAKVSTDSSMFHVNEADDGTGVLTVTDDGMTVHIRLASKRIVNLYAGTAEQAQSDSANVIQPTTDTVTYSDGAREEVYGFDVPVPVLDEGFDVAILGEKGTWYDHKVTVANPLTI